MKVEVINPNIKVITADAGMVLTEWQEGSDILDYTYTARQYSPVAYDTSGIREITQEESDRLIEEQIRIIEANRNR